MEGNGEKRKKYGRRVKMVVEVEEGAGERGVGG